MLSRRALLATASAALSAGCKGSDSQMASPQETAVIIQMMADPQDPTVSINFTFLERTRPKLNLGQLRKQVAQVEIDGDHGAAVLLDKQGLIGVCAHEVVGKRCNLRFFLGPDDICETTAVFHPTVDTNHDVAFAIMENPELIDKKSLLPVNWNSVDYDYGVTANDGEMLFLGFPFAGNFVLHANLGSARKFIPELLVAEQNLTFSGTTKCLVQNQGNSDAGMSGGPAYRDGKFAGLVDMTFHSWRPDVQTFVTPAAIIAQDFWMLLPERARAAGVRQLDKAKIPEACTAGGKQFRILEL